MQSLNSLGAHRLGGNFVSLLDREVVGAYAYQIAEGQQHSNETEIATQVDCHNLLFYLSIIDRLLRAVAQPNREENISLLQAWGDARLRLQQAIDLLVDSALSDSLPTTRIREFVAKWRQASTRDNLLEL